MAQFKTIVEAVLSGMGGELARVELQDDGSGYYRIPNSFASTLSVGDTITIEERETEIE